jgi:tRNA(Arg) A34 adenosine deaminase TadA
MTRRVFAAGLCAAGSLAYSLDANGEHEQYMRHAIEAAGNNPQAPFGAVIVDRERKEILAKGFNQSSQNPVWHGEIDAINRCAADHPGIDWKRLALYTTAEPCPMCQSAIVWAGMPLVAYGTSIPFLKQLGWGQIDIRAEQVAQAATFRATTVIGGVLENECNALFGKVHLKKR